MGKTIAIKMRSLEVNQRLIAEKKINDILYEAEMGTLTPPRSASSSGYPDHNWRVSNYSSHTSSPHFSPQGSSPSTSLHGGYSPGHAYSQIGERAQFQGVPPRHVEMQLGAIDETQHRGATPAIGQLPAEVQSQADGFPQHLNDTQALVLSPPYTAASYVASFIAQ